MAKNKNKTRVVALIGGTGFDSLAQFQVSHREVVRTPYGDPSGILKSGTLDGKSLVFLPRHGRDHKIPPHKVNYRANIWSLKSMGVTEIVAFAAVGGISDNLRDGTIVIPDQLIDYTWGREHTFFDGDSSRLEHIDFTYPYSSRLRQDLIQAASKARVRVVSKGCYGATQGPRLETAAEIDRLENDGADVVGMTGMPEAALARELGLEYVCLAIVVNAAAGRSDQLISMEAISNNLEKGSKRALRVLKKFL